VLVGIGADPCVALPSSVLYPPEDPRSLLYIKLVTFPVLKATNIMLISLK